MLEVVFRITGFIFGPIAARWRLLRLSAMPGMTLGRGVCVSALVLGKATDGAHISIGDNCSIARGACLIAKFGNINIGAGTHIGMYSVITARENIDIGADCLIAEHVTIRDQDHAVEPGMLAASSGFKTAGIHIGDNVWLGAKTTITKGVTIGSNSVIGANSVVTHDIPPGALAAGVPARVIRKLAEAPE